MNYYISDLHLFCKSQTQAGVNYDNRPFSDIGEMNAYIFERWNKKITNADTVYILGDIALRGRNDDLIPLIAQLRGKKVLVKGNHDDLSDYRYAQLFYEVCAYKEITDNIGGKAYKLVLHHYPIMMWNGQHRGTILCYGHTHNSVEEDFFQDCIQRMNDGIQTDPRRQNEPTIRAINVGACMPYINYEPRTLKELLND